MCGHVDIEKYISGAILFEETLFDKSEDGKQDLVQFLKDRGIVVGAKVDQGTKPLPGTDKELYTVGVFVFVCLFLCVSARVLVFSSLFVCRPDRP